MSEPIPVVYEADDLRAIATLMDDISKQDADLTVTGEAFEISRHKTSGPGPEDGPRWETSIEFKMWEG